jgi:phosphatidylinositol glycan class H protein
MATIITVLKRLSSPPSQTLHSLQPTPSTASYTVSTRQQSRSLPARLAFYVGIAVRVLIGISAFVLLWTKWRVSSAKSTAVLLWLCGRAGEDSLVELAERLEWRYLAPGALLLFYLILQRGYKGMHYASSFGKFANL